MVFGVLGWNPILLILLLCSIGLRPPFIIELKQKQTKKSFYAKSFEWFGIAGHLLLQGGQYTLFLHQSIHLNAACGFPWCGNNTVPCSPSALFLFISLWGMYCFIHLYRPPTAFSPSMSGLSNLKLQCNRQDAANIPSRVLFKTWPKFSEAFLHALVMQ